MQRSAHYQFLGSHEGINTKRERKLSSICECNEPIAFDREVCFKTEDKRKGIGEGEREIDFHSFAGIGDHHSQFREWKGIIEEKMLTHCCQLPKFFFFFLCCFDFCFCF